MYYNEVGESRNSYTRLLFLNEIVSGQNSDYILDLFRREKEEAPRFDPNDCRICLTGLRKSIYSGVYAASADRYMRIYVGFERAVREYWDRHGIVGEIFLHLYGEKRIILVFSRRTDAAAGYRETVQAIQDILQASYEKSLLTDRVYCNQTYWIEDPTTLEALPSALAELAELSKLSFFKMEPAVMSPLSVESERIVPPEADTRELRTSVVAAMSGGNFPEFRRLFEELMLGKIKRSFSKYLLEDAALLFKQFYLQCLSAYDIPSEANEDAAFDVSRHPSIESFVSAISAKFEKAAGLIAGGNRRYSPLTQKAIRVLKTSYSKRDLSLTYVAEQICVSPAYLSSVFNREVGMNIASYIAELRIGKAKELLRDTQKIVSAIAAEAGSSNKRYFCEVFKKKTGMTPSEYRCAARRFGSPE